MSIQSNENQDSEYRSGTPSLEEWNGLWKSAPSDPPVSDDEYEGVTSAMNERLSSLGKVGFEEGCSFYFRGDNYGDRTQYLEVVDFEILTPALIRKLQSWLHDPTLRMWRILIVTYIDDASAILIYPSAIRTGQFYGNTTEQALMRIASDALKRQKHAGDH